MKIPVLISLLPAALISSCTQNATPAPAAPPLAQPGQVAQGNPYGVPGATAYTSPVTQPGAYTPQATTPYQPVQPINPPAAPTYPTLPPVTPAVSATATTAGTSYTIQKGDTLWGLSRRYGVSADAIREANQIQGDNIMTGTSITIPAR